MKPQDNAANIQNANLGTKGTNRQYAQSQGNRGKQLAGKISAPVTTKGSGKSGRR